MDDDKARAGQSFGSNPSGGFNDLSKAFKAEPSIENYVKLRRSNPTGEIEIAILGGIDPMFYMEDKLRRYGIDVQLVLGAMDADPDAISELSLQLMEKIIEARQLAQAGQTHLVRRGLAVPEKLIDWIINCSLDGLSWNDELYIPRELIVLIRERLGGSNPEYRKGAHAHNLKHNAAMIGGQLKAQGMKPTLHRLATILGVAPSTVKRWFKPGELQREIDRWSQLFDEKGEMRPLVSGQT